jgi:hypothetical protein
MDTETERNRPGPTRERNRDWIAMIEYCPERGCQIIWYARVADGAAVTKKRRFRRCCVCAAALWKRRAAA